MRDNTRRNRNIGTKKQGYGQNNKLTIPEPYFYQDLRCFVEKLGKYTKTICKVNGYEFVFVTEALRADCYHPCSIEDVTYMLSHIPVEDYGELRLIVFRQPKRKEEILSPVWGRLIYAYEFEGRNQPAIVLEAVRANQYLKWSKKLVVDDQNEFERLQEDGHVFVADRRHYFTKIAPENARSTQLYRSLLHEFGHYVHYVNILKWTNNLGETVEERKKYYFDSITTDEKENLLITMQTV